MKRFEKVLLVIVAAVILAYVGGVGMYYILGIDFYGTFLEITVTDIRHYGVYNGNRDNKIPSKFIRSYFPEKIMPYFTDPVYHYKSQRPGIYACEAWLEFTIEEEKFFEGHYSELQQLGSPQPFPYNDAYEVWVISNELDLYEQVEYREEPELAISYSKIGFILCDKEEQRFIYAALLVANGGTAPVEVLSYIWDKLDIDPIEYEQNIQSCTM